MWRIPMSLIAGGSEVGLTVTSNTLIGNLWTFLGSPAGDQDVVVTVDGADAGNIQVTADWSGGSTFQITCINGGRVIGLGGNGGAGGADFGATGNPGVSGIDGGHALSSDGFTINVDIDDGFLMGGGGGGGGGAYEDLGATGNPGGGGGGGAGFSVTNGGAAGAPSGSPVASAGTDGGSSGPGLGGAGGSANTGGGDGGKFGSGGQTGRSTNIFVGSTFDLYGGIGGKAGAAFRITNAATINYNGVKSSATLRSESRIKGEDTAVWSGTTGFEDINQSVVGASSTGIIFELNGNLSTGNLSGVPITVVTRWLSGTSIPIAALYDVRERNLTGDTDGGATWGNRVNATPGTWSSIAADRTQAITSAAGIQTAATLLEIRRNDVPGNPNDEIISSFFLMCTDENGV